MAKAGILPKEMFKLDYNLGRELASAALAVQDARFVFIEDKSRTGSDVPEKTALHTIIAEAEEYILNNFVRTGFPGFVPPPQIALRSSQTVLRRFF